MNNDTSLTKATVIVVNDDPVQLHMASGLVRKEGVNVLSFESAEAALAMIQEGCRPDLIVTDLHMPGIDGWRFCRLLRSPEFTPMNKTRILVVSATYSGMDSENITHQIGADAFLAVPYKQEELRMTVRKLLEGDCQRFSSSILVVEDSRSLREMIAEEFRRQGYDVFEAPDGETVRSLLGHKRFDVVVLDHHLPDATGLDLLSHLKPPGTTAVVIIMTTNLSPDLAVEAMKRGADAFIHKPFKMEYLLDLIAKAKRERALLRIEDLLEQRTRELRESEEKHRLLVENASDAILVVQDGVIKFPNPKTEELLGYSAAELASIPLISHLHPENRNILTRRNGKPQGNNVPGTCQFRVINRRREELWLESKAVSIPWDGRPALLHFVRDITRQKKLESQFHQAQKMEAIGTLAGGIAHDFNNLLMGIQGYASLILLGMETTDPHYEKLKIIEEQTYSGVNLTRQLLGYARKGRYEVKPIDVNQAMKKTAAIFGRTRKEIRICERYQENLWTVEADDGQLEQVLLNLCVNAWEAMPGGGKLYLESKNVTLDESAVAPYGQKPGRYVKISVTDTGVGMDRETKERIFEPFFTTKGMGRGTGLGMASVYGIVKAHAGIIEIFSEKGHGASFTIYLPASGKKVSEEERPSPQLLRGEETILVVDDEAVILNLTKEYLRMLGYKVLAAGSGEEAVGIYQESKRDIDLVILDMIMPGMGGGETYDALKKINSDINVLLSSGYSLDERASHIMERGCRGFIQKPYNIDKLSQKIRDVLSERP